MAPNYAGRGPGRMQHRDDVFAPAGGAESGFARQENTFIIGNKAFFMAVKRALDIAGGFHIVGAFRMEELSTSLRRSKLLGQVPRVAVIHEPPGHRQEADKAAHAVLETYPQSGIVLITGDELEAESERKLGVHDFNAIVAPESVIKNPVTLSRDLHTAIDEAGSAQQAA